MGSIYVNHIFRHPHKRFTESVKRFTDVIPDGAVNPQINPQVCARVTVSTLGSIGIKVDGHRSKSQTVRRISQIPSAPPAPPRFLPHAYTQL